MSKYFNETQKASQRTQKQSVTHELDIRRMLETINQGSASATEVADVRLQQCRKVQVDGGGRAPLILRQGNAALPALEAYRVLRTRLMNVQAKSGLRSIAFTSSLPNEGKTLTVMNIGLCYSQLADQRVLIIDADLRTLGLSTVLGHPAASGLAEVLAGQVTPDEAILATDHENLFALPAGSVPTSPPELFTGRRWQEFVGWCSETFKVVLIDTPPILPFADFELISAACDGIVLVVRAGGVDHDTLQKATATVDSKKLLGVILNAVKRDPKSYYGYSYGYGTR